MNETQKRLHRKLWAFYVILLTVCLPSSIRFEMNWPLAALIGGLFLFLCASIVTEKWIYRKFETIIDKIVKKE